MACALGRVGLTPGRVRRRGALERRGPAVRVVRTAAGVAGGVSGLVKFGKRRHSFASIVVGVGGGPAGAAKGPKEPHLAGAADNSQGRTTLVTRITV